MASKRKRFTIRLDARNEKFGIRNPRAARWTKGGRAWTYTDRAPSGDTQTFWIEDAETGGAEPLYDPEKITGKELFKKLNFSFHSLSDDLRKILFKERRRTSRPTRTHGNVFLLDIKALSLTQITHTAKDQRNSKLSPSGKLLGVVRNDDIFVVNISTGEEKQLTNNSSPTLYNGRFGWVYEEELGLTDGFLFSPDSKWIAYWQTDEKDVPLVNIPRYDDLHMSATPTRYPKAGDKNPKVRIGVVSVKGGSTKWLNVNPPGDHYLSRMQWLDDGRLLIQRIPRLQQRMDLLLVNPKSGDVKTIIREESPYWVDGQGDVTVLEDGKRFLWRSDRDGFSHIYLYDLNGKMIRQVTRGDWEVSQLVGVDNEHQLCYFLAARPDPTQRSLYYAPLSGGKAVKLTEEPGVHSINMNPQATLHIDSWSNSNTPPQSNLHSSSGKLLRSLLENNLDGFNGYALAKWEYGTFETEDGVTLYYKMLKPADFDTSKKYPVYMSNYGGPGSQNVMDSWNTATYERSLTELGIIVFSVDNRGGGGRGREWRKLTYKNLGHWETNDQAEGAKWIAKQTYVDAERISMYGWSYGGYMAASCILRYPKLWRCAIAGAPVTDWRFYDTIYTERYMQTPQENPEGYKTSSLLTYAKQLEGKLLLIHGTSDDNVHVQNTMRLAEELQKAGKQFELMLYPHQRHGVGRRQHLNELKLDFLKRHMLEK